MRNKLNSNLTLILIMGTIHISCSSVSGGKHKGDANSTTLRYQYKENGCDTGIQVFKSREALCRGLLDDALNKGCAMSLRVQHYKRSCDSTYSDTSETPAGNDTYSDTSSSSNNTSKPFTINAKPVSYDYGSVQIEAPTIISLVSKIPMPDAEGYFTWTYKLTAATWTTRLSAGFKETIDFSPETNRLRLKGSSHCDGDGEISGVLSHTGQSVLQLKVSGDTLCAGDLKHGLFYLHGEGVVTQKLKNVQMIFMSFEAL